MSPLSPTVLGCSISLLGMKLKQGERDLVIFKDTSMNNREANISAKTHKRQRCKRQSVTAKQEKSQTPKVLTAILT